MCSSLSSRNSWCRHLMAIYRMGQEEIQCPLPMWILMACINGCQDKTSGGHSSLIKPNGRKLDGMGLRASIPGCCRD